jgi:folate/biopterin transporter
MTTHQAIQWKEKLKSTVFLGNEPTPELIAILVVYFVQGILGLARLAVSFFLKDELGMTPVEVSVLLGVVSIPWMIKPLFGLISDGVPLVGYRRRSYLILSGVLGTIAWVMMATVVNTPLLATIAICLSSLSVAFSDVIADSLVVERSRQQELGDIGSLQSLCWGVSALGGLITAYLSGFLLGHFTPQTIFWVTATFPLIVSAIAILVDEKPVKSAINLATVKEQLKQLKVGITTKAILLPTLFLFIWQATPTADAAFFFFSTNELHFQPEFLGRVRLVTSVAALVGVWLFQKFFKRVEFRLIFGWSTVISAVLGMTTLILVTHMNRAWGIPDQWFSLGDSLVLTVMGQIAFMPVLVLAARLCPPGVEATFFALLMAVMNFAGFISYQGGALLMKVLAITDSDFSQLWLLVIITNLSTLLPLILVGWLPEGNCMDEVGVDRADLPVLEPEPANAKLAGQHLLPDFLPEMLPTNIINQLDREEKYSAR